MYTRKRPQTLVEGLGLPEFDAEGRYIEAGYGKLAIISLYQPSGSSSEERQQAKFRFMEQFFPHLHALARSGKEIILCGDWNIAHQEIDLKNWKSNQKNSGFLPEERAWLTRVFDELGFVDVYRKLYPDHSGEAYTWWSNRGQAWAKNVGWRIDYQIATPGHRRQGAIRQRVQGAALQRSRAADCGLPLHPLTTPLPNALPKQGGKKPSTI